MSSSATAPRTVVRPARSNDAPKLSQFFREAWREAGAGALGFEGATDGAIAEIASEDFLRRRLATPAILTTVAEEEGRLVGFASLRRLDRRAAEVSGLAVLERARGRGVGARLLRKSLETARKRGVGAVAVRTGAENERAVAFYKKAGFTESGKATRRVGGRMVAVRLLSRRL